MQGAAGIKMIPMKTITLVAGPSCGLTIGGVKDKDLDVKDGFGNWYTITARKDSDGRIVFVYHKPVVQSK